MENGSHRLLRIPAKWVIRKIAEKLTNQKIPDLNSGLRAMRREVALPYLRLLPPGFSCVTTITLAFMSNQKNVAYVPIDYAKRAGKSKFKFVTDAYRYILQVLRMVMYFNPLKVLMPPAIWLVAFGVGKAVFDLAVPPVPRRPEHDAVLPDRVDHRLTGPAGGPDRPLAAGLMTAWTGRARRWAPHALTVVAVLAAVLLSVGGIASQLAGRTVLADTDAMVTRGEFNNAGFAGTTSKNVEFADVYTAETAQHDRVQERAGAR